MPQPWQYGGHRSQTATTPTSRTTRQGDTTYSHPAGLPRNGSILTLLQMNRTQKNKATSFHLGQLKAKLAKLKRELLTPSGGGGGAGAGFDVARTGVASIGFIGFPSVGKSTLMSKLTGQHSEAAAYEFTTLTSVPGQVVYNGECRSRNFAYGGRGGGFGCSLKCQMILFRR